MGQKLGKTWEGDIDRFVNCVAMYFRESRLRGFNGALADAL